jgi:hypothetical protein
MNRIRKTTDNEYIILNDRIFKLNKVNNYITFDDTKEAIKELSGFKTTTIYKTIQNKRVKIIDFDDYTNNFIYNKVEEYNKQPFYFLAKLKGLVEKKGREICNDVPRIIQVKHNVLKIFWIIFNLKEFYGFDIE